MTLTLEHLPMSARHFRMARRWRFVSAVQFAVAAAWLFVGFRWPAVVCLAGGLFATYAAWRAEREARRAANAERAWAWLEGS